MTHILCTQTGSSCFPWTYPKSAQSHSVLSYNLRMCKEVCRMPTADLGGMCPWSTKSLSLRAGGHGYPWTPFRSTGAGPEGAGLGTRSQPLRKSARTSAARVKGQQFLLHLSLAEDWMKRLVRHKPGNKSTHLSAKGESIAPLLLSLI